MRNLEIKSVEYNATASGDGDIYFLVQGGEITLSVESHLGIITLSDFSHQTDRVNASIIESYLSSDEEKEVKKYMKDNDIFNKYMDEVYEAASQLQ